MAKYIITTDNRKFDLSKAKNLVIADTQIHGVTLEAVYMTPSGLVIVQTDSVWEDRSHPGCCIGQEFHVADADEIASLARKYDCQTLLDLVPLEE